MPGTWTLAGIGLVVIAVVGGLAYFLARRKERLRGERSSYYHFRCPGCKRRLRYQTRQVGNRGKCSHCGGLVTFPPTSQSVD